MAGSYFIAIEKDGEFLFADKYRHSSEYIPSLCRAARLVDEKIATATLKIGSNGSKGVIGSEREWGKPESWWALEPQEVKRLADAARVTGLNYE